MKTTKAPKKSKKIRPGGDVVTVAGKTATIIRQVKTVGGREYVTFRARYWQDGQRKEITAPDIETAQQRARDALKHHESGSGHVMQFKPAEAANVAAAVAKLQEVGVPLLIAVADYVAARKALPSKWTVADAARGFAVFKAKEEAEAAGPKEMRFIDAVAKFHERNDKRGLSEGYKADCKKHLKIIGKTFNGTIIQTLKQPELTECIESSTKGGARRFNNLRCTLNALFGFCQKEGILPRDRTHEAALIEKKDQGSSENITIYTPAEMQVILANIGEELLPWALLGGFAGLRVSEIHRLKWENIRLDAGVITLDKSLTKTKRRRVIPIGDALHEWIEPIHKGKGPIYDLPYKTYEDRLHKGWAKMVDEDDKLLVEKRANAFRHSYGTYRFAILKDEFKVSAEMGNSPNELRASYAELALPQDAKAWFSIMPVKKNKRKKSKKVIPMPRARAA